MKISSKFFQNLTSKWPWENWEYQTYVGYYHTILHSASIKMDQKCAKKMWLHVEPHFFENYFVDKIQKFFKELILVFVVNRASSLNFTFIPNLKHCVWYTSNWKPDDFEINWKIYDFYAAKKKVKFKLYRYDYAARILFHILQYILKYSFFWIISNMYK